MKILCCGACIVGVLELLAATNVSYTAAESAYRDSYLAQPAQEEDGRRRPVVKHGTWYLDGKPVFWIGGWLHGNRTADWPKGNPDRQGIGHFAYSIPPGKELFDRIGFNSSQISHAPVQAGKALMGLPLGDRKRKFDQVEAEDADFIRGFGDVPMVVDFAYGFAAEIPEDVRKRTDQVTSWWHLFVPFCPENPEGARYYESYFLGGTRTLMRYGMNVFIQGAQQPKMRNQRITWLSIPTARKYSSMKTRRKPNAAESLSLDAIMAMAVKMELRTTIS